MNKRYKVLFCVSLVIVTNTLFGMMESEELPENELIFDAMPALYNNPEGEQAVLDRIRAWEATGRGLAEGLNDEWVKEQIFKSDSLLIFDHCVQRGYMNGLSMSCQVTDHLMNNGLLGARILTRFVERGFELAQIIQTYSLAAWRQYAQERGESCDRIVQVCAYIENNTQAQVESRPANSFARPQLAAGLPGFAKHTISNRLTQLFRRNYLLSGGQLIAAGVGAGVVGAMLTSRFSTPAKEED